MGKKIAISGKGGVGKTTITGILARLMAREGKKVVVIDADPDSNLASAIGIPGEARGCIKPLSQMYDLIEERTGMRPGTASGGTYILNPRVDDLLERYGVEGKDGVKLLVLGTIEAAGSGCFCPESTLLKRLMRHMILRREEYLLMDMEAGIEHLGRGTAENVDTLLVVVEPGMRSVETAEKIKALAARLGIKRLAAVLNKVTDEEEVVFIRKELEAREIELLGSLPYDKVVGEADMKGISPLDLGDSPVARELGRLKAALLGE